MTLFYQSELINGVTHLDREESRHCIKVLRKKLGDLIHITDGAGSLYTARISNTNPAKCEFEIEQEEREEKKDYYVHIGIAPPKNMDRLEWFVEKAVEIGIDEITLLKTVNSERTVVKLERLEKKAVAAMKQSLKCKLPKTNSMVPFNEVLHLNAGSKSIAYVDKSNVLMLSERVTSGINCVLIGPEGDFTKDEVSLAQQLGWTKVSLGKSRLRTETAGLVACHLINLFN